MCVIFTDFCTNLVNIQPLLEKAQFFQIIVFYYKKMCLLDVIKCTAEHFLSVITPTPLKVLYSNFYTFHMDPILKEITFI